MNRKEPFYGGHTEQGTLQVNAESRLSAVYDVTVTFIAADESVCTSLNEDYENYVEKLS